MPSHEQVFNGPPAAEQTTSHERELPVDQSHAIEAFEGVELYDPDAPATQYVRGVVAALCKEDEPVPEVFVAKGESPEAINGFTAGDVMVVNDGLLRSADTHEEAAGLLAHELTHYLRGHTCQHSSRKGTPNPRRAKDVLERVGDRRIAEIEADILGMKRMNDQGFNPLGAIRIAEKSAAQDKSKYKSLVHGDMLERMVTLEQVLNILDLEHLSPELHPLEAVPELGEIITMGSEAYASLPLQIQQGLLNGKADRSAPTDSDIAIQKRLLRTANTEQDSDEELLEAKARFLLGAKSISKKVSADAAALHEDLQMLSAPDVRTLLSPPNRTRLLTTLIERRVEKALYDETEGREALLDIKKVVRENHFILADKIFGRPYRKLDIEPEIVAAINEKKLNALPVEQRDRFFGKLFVWCTQANEPLYELDFRLSQMASRQEFSHPFMRRVAAHHADEVEKIKDPVGKLQYLMEHPETSAVDALARDEILATLSPKRTINYLLNLVAADESNIDSVYNAAVSLNPLWGYEWYPDTWAKMPVAQWRAKLPVFLIAVRGKSNGVNKLLRWNSLEIDNEGTAQPITSPTTFSKSVQKRYEEIGDALAVLDTASPNLMPQSLKEFVRGDELIESALFHNALRALSENPQEHAENLITLMRGYGVPRLQLNSLYKGGKELDSAILLWNKAVAAILENEEWRNDEKSLLCLAALGMAAPDIEVNLTVADFAFRRITELRNFEQGLALLEEFPHMLAVHGGIIQILIEEKALTAADFEQLNAAIESHGMDSILADNLGTIGKLSIIDSIIIPYYSSIKNEERRAGIKTTVIKGLQSTELLGALLSTSHDELPLKKYLAAQWWIKNRAYAREDNDHFTVEDYIILRYPHKTARLQHWLEHDYPPAGTYTLFDDTLGDIYLQSAPARFFAVRKLLLSKEDGVLVNSEGSSTLVEALMNSWLAAEKDTEEGIILRDLLLNLITKNDPATSYLHIGPMLQDMILKPPREPADLLRATRVISDNIVKQLVAQGRFKDAVEADYTNMHQRVHSLFIGREDEQGEPSRLQAQTKATTQQVLEAVDAVNTEPVSEKLSTMAFAALAGKKSGALGVKMLQLAGQYFDLSEEDKREFVGIYDDMKGQSRLQAYNTLVREAKRSPRLRQLLDSIHTFGPRIGGGSLFTVYKVYLHDGREVALGVKNPNTEYRVARLAEFADTGLHSTISAHPEDSTTLQLMSSLLGDASRWVLDELLDPDFAHKDSVFAAENDTRKGQGFKKGNTRYDLVTPDVIHTESSWIRSETFVHGTNLTGLKVSDDQPTDIAGGIIHRDDFKQVASVLARNYVYQVMKGNYAHSDIHPGNFRITPDNLQITIFDRHNLIPINDKLRSTLRAAFGSIMAGDLEAAAHTIAMHAAPADTDPDRLRATIRDIAAQATDPTQLVASMILTLKRGGINVPLDLSLLLRNFMSVSLLSKQAGFSNLGEAFLHTSYGLDELMGLAES